MGIGTRWMKTWLGVRFANESMILSYEVRAIDDSRSSSRVLKTPLGIQNIMTMVKKKKISTLLWGADVFISWIIPYESQMTDIDAQREWIGH